MLIESTATAAQRYLATWVQRCALVPAAEQVPVVLAPAAEVAVAWWADGPDDFLGVAAEPTGDDPFTGVRGARTWASAATDPAVLALDAALAAGLAGALASWTEEDGRALAGHQGAVDRADAGALRHLFALLAGLDGLVVHDSGPVAVALVAGLRSDDVGLQLHALAIARKLGLRSLQRDIAGLLDAPARLGHEGVEATLDALAELADGRSVRRLEEVLAARGPELSQHQAWRARHIVQVIRRAGRR